MNEAQQRAVQANQISEIVSQTIEDHWPGQYVPISLRYGIADQLWAAGYRKVEDCI